MDARTLVEALGGIWRGNNSPAFCPAHENHRTPALSVSQGEDGKLLLYCFAGCSYQDVMEALRRKGVEGVYAAPMPLPAASVPNLKLEAHARAIWREAVPIHGTQAETYLREGRGITCALPRTLRFHPACWHAPSAQALPAMIGLIEDGASFAVHRTYLARDGRGKADVSPSKMMLGKASGGAVRLSECAGRLVVAEGIETALSLACGLVTPCGPVWAALSAFGLTKLVLPAEPDRLIIATDGDDVGQAAGKTLAERAHALGWQVSLLHAPMGRDWNDIQMMKGGAK